MYKINPTNIQSNTYHLATMCKGIHDTKRRTSTVMSGNNDSWFTASTASLLATDSSFSNSNSKKNKTHKKVHFAPTARAKKVLHVKNYSLAELEATWYDDVELENILIDNQRSIRYTNDDESSSACSSSLASSSSVCIRGLENGIKFSNTQRREPSIYAVFQEQEKLRKYSSIIDTSYKIAKEYSKTTGTSVREAFQRASMDRKDVLNNNDDDDADSDCTSSQSDELLLGTKTTCADRSKALLQRRRERIMMKVTKEQHSS